MLPDRGSPRKWLNHAKSEYMLHYYMDVKVPCFSWFQHSLFFFFLSKIWAFLLFSVHIGHFPLILHLFSALFCINLPLCFHTLVIILLIFLLLFYISGDVTGGGAWEVFAPLKNSWPPICPPKNLLKLDQIWRFQYKNGNNINFFVHFTFPFTIFSCPPLPLPKKKLMLVPSLFLYGTNSYNLDI